MSFLQCRLENRFHLVADINGVSPSSFLASMSAHLLIKDSNSCTLSVHELMLLSISRGLSSLVEQPVMINIPIPTIRKEIFLSFHIVNR